MKEMRLNFIIVLLTIFIAFVAGYYALFIQDNYTVTEEDVAQIREVKRKFDKNYSPLLIINFNNIYRTIDSFELLRPVVSIKKSSGFMGDASVYSTDRECFADMKTWPNSIRGEKAMIWEEFRCGHRRLLPLNFFSTPPYLHPSGSSFAFHAFKLSKFPYNSSQWTEKELPHFHVSELKQVKNALDRFPAVFEFLSRLDADALLSILKGKNILITDEFLIEKNKDNFIFFDFEYKVYSLRKWSKYLENTPYQIKKYVEGKKCFLKEGNFCWEYTLSHALSLVSKRNIIVLAFALIIIIILMTLLYNKLEQQRLEDQKRKLALQVLTHEFRTPVASLLLLSEQFRSKLDLIPDEDTQELFLRLSSDVHRLHRLVESSNNYLKLQSGKKLVAFKFKKIPSINKLFENMLGPYLEEIDFRPLEKDNSFVLDEYWSLICVKNLVENALSHGKKPVIVKLKLASENEFHVTVTDAGSCEFKKLSDITAVFAKGQQSEGTGLGMNIVSKVIKDMDGELLYSRNPTTFTIILKNQKENNGKIITR